MKQIHESELNHIEGGFVLQALLVAAIGAVGFVAAGVINHWEEFKEGVSEGYETWSPKEGQKNAH